jgi:hypothetical protein
LFLWGALFDERTGQSFIFAAGPVQRSLSLVLVTWDSWPYLTVSDLRLPFSSPPTTRWVTVEDRPRLHTGSELSSKLVQLITLRHGSRRKHLFYCCRACLPRRCVATVEARTTKTPLQRVPLRLRVDSLPWEPVCLRSLPSNGSTRCNIHSSEQMPPWGQVE